MNTFNTDSELWVVSILSLDLLAFLLLQFPAPGWASTYTVDHAEQAFLRLEEARVITVDEQRLADYAAKNNMPLIAERRRHLMGLLVCQGGWRAFVAIPSGLLLLANFILLLSFVCRGNAEAGHREQALGSGEAGSNAPKLKASAEEKGKTGQSGEVTDHD